MNRFVRRLEVLPLAEIDVSKFVGGVFGGSVNPIVASSGVIADRGRHFDDSPCSVAEQSFPRCHRARSTKYHRMATVGWFQLEPPSALAPLPAFWFDNLTGVTFSLLRIVFGL